MYTVTPDIDADGDFDYGDLYRYQEKQSNVCISLTGTFIGGERRFMKKREPAPKPSNSIKYRKDTE